MNWVDAKTRLYQFAKRDAHLRAPLSFPQRKQDMTMQTALNAIKT